MINDGILFDAFAPELAADYVPPARSPEPRRTVAPAPPIDGDTYDAARDGARLRKQLVRVFNLMADSKPRTLAVIAELVEGSEAGVSARLRDFRKRPYGSHHVKRAYVADGVWSYQLFPNGPLRGVPDTEDR